LIQSRKVFSSLSHGLRELKFYQRHLPFVLKILMGLSSFVCKGKASLSGTPSILGR
jgi:hypothetical protein